MKRFLSVMILTAVFCLAAGVPQLEEAVVKLDGGLDEKEWGKAAVYRGLWTLGDRTAAKAGGECRFFVSDNFLYGALTAFEPDVSTLKMSVKPEEVSRYPRIHESDEVLNLFFSNRNRWFCQIAFTPAGVRTFYGVRPTLLLYRDWRQKRLLEVWKPEIEHAVRISPGNWTVEFRLRLDDFDGFRSSRWQFNVCRERRAGANELTTLFPMSGVRFNDYRQYEEFRIDGLTESGVSEAPADCLLAPKDMAQWSVLAGTLKESRGALTVFGRTKIVSREKMIVFPGQKYQISGEFRSLGKSSQPLLFGLQLLDSKNREILPQQVLTVPRSDTVLTAAVSPGESELLLKDASHWKVGPEYFVAFATSPDYSDLPNRELSYTAGVREIVREGEFWRVRLNGSHRFTGVAGTAVRLHATGASYLYATGKALDIPSKWHSFQVTIPGFRQPDRNVHNLLWPGTASVRLLIWLNDSDPEVGIAFRNVKLKML